MSKFELNSRVSLLSNPKRKGKVDEIHPPKTGFQFYDILWDDSSLETVLESDLIDEVVSKSPWEIFSNNAFGDYRHFSIITTIHKIRNSTSNTISTLKASKTIFKPYQFKPLLKFLKSDIKRIIVADEVGLGKTIEAGHILLELAARNSLKNSLIICTKSLRDKWQEELKDKFNFTFKIYNTTSEFINDLKSDIDSSNRSIFGILNYEKSRNVELQKLIGGSNYEFDLLVCDEAHKIRNSETDQHKGVAKLVEKSNGVVFLTATPIMTELRNLFNLVKVLDKESFDTYDIFQNAINQNKPFIRALSQIQNQVDLKIVSKDLHESQVLQEVTADEEVFFSKQYTIGELFENDDLYQRVRNQIESAEDGLSLRVQIQQDLVELNSLNNIYTRTRKRDVQNENDVITRIPYTITVQMSDEERQLFSSVFDEYGQSDMLGMMQKKRQISSCIAAYFEKKEVLTQGKYESNIYDSKFELFKSIIEEVVIKKSKKIIVFAFFTKTLLYLRIKLRELGIESEIIYGDIKDRTARINNFQHNSAIKVLLSSEVGSEGLDLQFSDALVNYDLPWNPMVVEQRIGRIDRVGQQSRIIHIYNLVLADTIEEKIYHRLFERINLFRESIGDLEEILGENENSFELIRTGIEQLYTTKLTEQQQNAILDNIRAAIISEKLTLSKIKLGLQEAFANDFHFQNEIENIEKNRRYLSKGEIITYLENAIRTHLSTFQLKHIDETVSELCLPSKGTNTLFNFIEKYKDSITLNSELENLYRKFKARFHGERILKITFDQDYSFLNKSVEFISAFHPLINAITNYFSEQGLDKNQAFKIAIKKENFGDEFEFEKGFYILALYRINIEKKFGDGKSNNLYFLKCAVANLNGEEVTIIDEAQAEYFYSALQASGEPMFEDLQFNSDAIKEMRAAISMKVVTVQQQIKEDEKVKFHSSLRRRAEQEIQYLEKRIERMKRLLAEGKGIEQILKSEIENFTHKIEAIKMSLDNATIEVSHTLISINLVEVI